MEVKYQCICGWRIGITRVWTNNYGKATWIIRQPRNIWTYYVAWCVRASLVMLFNAMPDTIKCIHKFLQTSRVDRRRAKTNVHTLVINPSMILTSTLVPGGTLDDKVQFHLIPRLPSVLPIHGRYGHTGTIHSVDTNLWLWVSVIRSKIHHRRGY